MARKKVKAIKKTPKALLDASHESWKMLEKMEETVNDLLEQVYWAGFEDGVKATGKKKNGGRNSALRDDA